MHENISIKVTDEMREITIRPSSEHCTKRVQNALDATADPIRVIFETGHHISTGLRLRSNVTLHFDEGAVLQFEPQYEAYITTAVDIEAEQSDRAMIVAKGAERIAITGQGQILCDGSRAFSTGEDHKMGTLVPADLRPRVMVLDQCRDTTITGLNIKDAPMWTLHFVDCDGLRLSDIQIDNNRKMPNTDGIVIDGCREVEIKNCNIRTADDGIVLKTSIRSNGNLTGACAQVQVTHCLIESRSCALKLGTESFSPFRNITFEHIKIENSNRGIGLFSRDGGAMENIRFSNIALDCYETPEGYWGSGEAVTINTIDRRPEDGPAGPIRHVVIEDISGTMEGAINLFAARASDVSHVTLRRISLRQNAGLLGTGLCYDLRPGPDDRFPSEDAAGRVNAWRLDADGRVIGLEPYPGGLPAVFAQDIDALQLENVHVQRPNPLPSYWNSDAIVERQSFVR